MATSTAAATTPTLDPVTSLEDDGGHALCGSSKGWVHAEAVQAAVAEPMSVAGQVAVAEHVEGAPAGGVKVHAVPQTQPQPMPEMTPPCYTSQAVGQTTGSRHILCCYTAPTTPGRFRLDVTALDGKHIGGSPFSLQVGR